MRVRVCTPAYAVVPELCKCPGAGLPQPRTGGLPPGPTWAPIQLVWGTYELRGSCVKVTPWQDMGLNSVPAHVCQCWGNSPSPRGKKTSDLSAGLLVQGSHGQRQGVSRPQHPELPCAAHVPQLCREAAPAAGQGRVYAPERRPHI